MMFNFVSTSLLADRLDAEYYSEDQINNQIILEKFGVSQLASVCHSINVGYTGELTSVYVQSGVPLYRVSDIDDIFLNEVDVNYVPQEFARNNLQIAIEDGDLVLAAVGNTIGKAAIKGGNISNGVCSRALMIARPKHDSIDAYFLISHIATKFGQKSLLRGVSGSAQPVLNTPLIAGLAVPKANKLCQKYIGDKVRQAERMRAWAKALDINIASYFANLVANPLPPRVSWLAKKEDLDPYRINPKQYDPVVLDLIHRAKANGIRLEPLSGLTGARQIAGGATPKGAQYFDKGVLFARVQNVKPLRLDLSDAVYIDQSADEELARSRCSTDDIILTITGYPGTASLVTEEDLPVNINQHSVRFNIRDDIEPGYVCAALNSKFLKYQVDRLAIGGTRDALDYPSVGRLLIPRYEAELEQKIGEQARSVIAAGKLSQRLTNAAKLLVEALIEGQLTEVELIAAEQALQAGNDQLDRHILNRLKTDGVDGQGQPLFSDLDQLYSLLQQASLS